MTALPSIHDAKLPGAYVDAKDALERCVKVDQCEGWDREAAMASYARQAQDDSLRRLSTRIQARAIRRCGELLKQRQAAQEDAKQEAADAKPAMTAEEWLRGVVDEAIAAEIEARLAVLRGRA